MGFTRRAESFAFHQVREAVREDNPPFPLGTRQWSVMDKYLHQAIGSAAPKMAQRPAALAADACPTGLAAQASAAT